MTTTPTPTNAPSALAVMASRMTIEPQKLLATLKATVCSGASDPEIAAFVMVANKYGLDPFTKEIYAFPQKGGIQPIVSVDGWIKLMNAHPKFDGIEFEYLDGADGKPVSVTAIVYRKDITRAIKCTEYFSEAFRATEPWKQYPRRMLRHKALIQVARLAFGFSGIYEEEEVVRTPAATAPAFVPKATLTEVPVELVAAEAPKETIHGKLEALLFDSRIGAADFLVFLKKQGAIKRAKDIRSLSEEIVQDAITNFEEIKLAILQTPAPTPEPTSSPEQEATLIEEPELKY